MNGLSDVSYNFYIGGENLMIEGTGWTREAEHTGILEVGIKLLIILSILFVDPRFNSAIAFAFIGEYSNYEPDQIVINAFFNFLETAETDKVQNLLPEEYIMIVQTFAVYLLLY